MALREEYLETPFPLPPSLYGRSFARSLGRSYADVIMKFSHQFFLPMVLRWRASRAEAPLKIDETYHVVSCYCPGTHSEPGLPVIKFFCLPYNKHLRPSSDVVLLPCRTKLPLGSTVARQTPRDLEN